MKACVDSDKPALMNFSSSVALDICFTLELPFAADFPNEVGGLRDEDCKGSVGTRERVTSRVSEVTDHAA